MYLELSIYRKPSNKAPGGATYFLDIWGALKIFVVAGHIPVEIFLLINCFFDATHTSNRMCSEGKANFR